MTQTNAHAESLAYQPIRKEHVPFYDFNKALITRTDFLITNADGKITFQFFANEANKFERRTPNEGGVEL